MTAPRTLHRLAASGGTLLLAAALSPVVATSAGAAGAAGPTAAVSTTVSTTVSAGLSTGLSTGRNSHRAARAGGVRLRHAFFHGADGWRRGRLDDVRVSRAGTLVLTRGAGRARFAGRSYDRGRWTSPWVAPGFDLTELIASWQARTPRDSWIVVRVQGRTAAGRRTSWDTMARWTTSEGRVKRTTLSGQGDDLARVNVDTWQAPGGLAQWRVQVDLMRRTGTRIPVALHRVGAVASRLPDRTGVATSRPTRGVGRVLDVPTFSQMIHRGHSPQWGGGGEAWCSPTSTAMVLAWHGARPRWRHYDWVGAGHPNAFVDHVARMTYDHGYGGTGNWPFNTAYAGTRVREAYVTRMRNLRPVERLVARGVPVIVSVRFERGELDNAPISSTNGHLLVIVGFTESGDVVVNDPAGRRNADVRRTYDRGQFEDVWLPTSGGLAYVIRR